MPKRSARKASVSPPPVATRTVQLERAFTEFTGVDGLRVLYFTNVAADPDALVACLRTQPYMPKVSTYPRWPNMSTTNFVWTVDPSSELAALDAPYAFSAAHRNPLPAHAMPAPVQQLRDTAFALVRKAMPELDEADRPNAALLNHYRDGSAKLSAHSDADPWLAGSPDGTPTLVLSVSFGATRMIRFRSKERPAVSHVFMMQHNSLLVMVGADTQRNWTHEVPVSSVAGERFNITFRTVVPDRVPLQMKFVQRKALEQYREAYRLALDNKDDAKADSFYNRLLAHLN